jgi:predicted transposase/invertase (TIGR01784 family)
MPSKDDLYHLSLKAYRDNKNAMDYAIKVAAEEGFQQGLQEGLEKARQQGFQQGRLEVRLEVAREMKAMNMPVELIMDITKLSRVEIEKL